MNIYPTSYKIEFKIQQKEQFFKRMKTITSFQLFGGSMKTTSKFIGTVTDSKIRIQIHRQFWRNAFRPIIIGDIEDDIIKIRLGVHFKVIIFWLIGLAMVGKAIIESGNYIYLLGGLVWSIFWYLGGWLLYTIDLDRTYKGIEHIKHIADKK